MDFWKNSSTTMKAVIIGVGAVALLLLVVLIANLGNRPQDDGALDVLTPAASVTSPAPTTQPPTAEPGQAQVTADNSVNVRQGPSTDYPIIGMLIAGQTAPVVGRNADSSWWAIEFPTPPANQGWVSGDFVAPTNVENAPILEGPALPTPTTAPPVAIVSWRGEYFANRNLQGEPVLVRNDERIDFNWGNQPPADGMPATNWSARWTINRNVPAGTYRFSIWVDDGVRLFVDDELLIDGWQAGTARNYTADINLAAGSHSVRIEYFQGDGGAMIQTAVGYVEGYTDWRAEYFGNPELAEPPLVVRNEEEINFDWGTGSPATGIPADNWSARWTRSYDLSSGEYTFTANVQGGVRLWLNDRLLIDGWSDQSARILSADTGRLDSGIQRLRVEYHKTTGPGRLSLSATQRGGEPIPPRAVIQGPTRAQIDEEVSFSAAGSEVAAGSHIDRIDWDFGDGTTAQGVSVTHTYSAPGIYNVVLTLTDDRGLADTNTQQIRIVEGEATPVPPSPPVAVIDAPAQADAGEPVTFYAGNSQSITPLVSFTWDFGDGEVADTVSVQKAYAEPGLYTVTLTIADDQGLQSSAQQQITVNGSGTGDAATTPATTEPAATPEISPEAAPTEEQPVASPTTEAGAGDGSTPESPVLVTVDGTQVRPTVVDGVTTLTLGPNQTLRLDASGPAAADPSLAFSWEMGDGSPPLTGAVIEHSYAEPGVYTVQVDVDSGGETATTAFQVVVEE